MLHHLEIENFTTLSGVAQDISLSYQYFGKPLHEAPIVLVNHALTGNSNVTGPDGWWSALIGEGKCIDTDRYTVMAFNIPGNGYDGFVIENYKDFVAGDIARIFLIALQELKIDKLYAIIGGVFRRWHCMGNGRFGSNIDHSFDSGGLRLEINRLAYCQLPDSRAVFDQFKTTGT